MAIRRIPIRYRIKVRAIASALKASLLLIVGRRSMARIFQGIHARNDWRGEESASGTGSSLAQTGTIRAAIPDLLNELKCSRVLDAPCGDFHWLSQVKLGVEYIGYDVVPALIAANQRKYGSTMVRFMLADITRDPLPEADLILCRDCLVHLSYDDAFLALNNFLASGASYLLTTTFPERESNRNIRTGDWRPLNLQLPPFSLPPPERVINENCSESGGIYQDKTLALWNLRAF